ncbi:hypothetical protein AB838_22055 [Rhodobacteraceae bacterium (ex Bugula neritina AB1)]|nr:hypothetical protein AB838_22055 [Rhodobacteraceae bacterium (ex Bugula neritina AB1)]
MAALRKQQADVAELDLLQKKDGSMSPPSRTWSWRVVGRFHGLFIIQIAACKMQAENTANCLGRHASCNPSGGRAFS